MRVLPIGNRRGKRQVTPLDVLVQVGIFYKLPTDLCPIRPVQHPNHGGLIEKPPVFARKTGIVVRDIGDTDVFTSGNVVVIPVGELIPDVVGQRPSQDADTLNRPALSRRSSDSVKPPIVIALRR